MAKPTSIPRESPRLAIPRAVLAALAVLEDEVPDHPSSQRIALRDARAAIYRAYPSLRLTDSEVAQMMAEQDGEAVEDTDVSGPF